METCPFQVLLRLIKSLFGLADPAGWSLEHFHQLATDYYPEKSNRRYCPFFLWAVLASNLVIGKMTSFIFISKLVVRA
jgi:hypothetical protein